MSTRILDVLRTGQRGPVTAVAGALLLAMVLAVPAGATTLIVRDGTTGIEITTPYRWLVQKDLT